MDFCEVNKTISVGNVTYILKKAATLAVVHDFMFKELLLSQEDLVIIFFLI